MMQLDHRMTRPHILARYYPDNRANGMIDRLIDSVAPRTEHHCGPPDQFRIKRG